MTHRLEPLDKHTLIFKQMTIKELKAENARLKAEVELLTKAVASSPVAQVKLKELEGKNTYEEINPKEGEQP